MAAISGSLTRDSERQSARIRRRRPMASSTLVTRCEGLRDGARDDETRRPPPGPGQSSSRAQRARAATKSSVHRPRAACSRSVRSSRWCFARSWCSPRPSRSFRSRAPSSTCLARCSPRLAHSLAGLRFLDPPRRRATRSPACRAARATGARAADVVVVPACAPCEVFQHGTCQPSARMFDARMALVARARGACLCGSSHG